LDYIICTSIFVAFIALPEVIRENRFHFLKIVSKVALLIPNLKNSIFAPPLFYHYLEVFGVPIPLQNPLGSSFLCPQ